jgi:hypothetical protein
MINNKMNKIYMFKLKNHLIHLHLLKKNKNLLSLQI